MNKQDGLRRGCTYRYSLPGDIVDCVLILPAPLTRAEFTEVSEFIALALRALERTVIEVATTKVSQEGL